MPDRIPCKNPECTNTILPSTAERTAGFCMPCIQKNAQKEHDDYVKKNRRNVNEFEGIADLVEALKIIHSPRKHDPLINWIPHPLPIDQIYETLSEAEQNRVATYATTLIEEGRKDEADTIVLCLAAFTEAKLDSCLRALVSQGVFWPSLPFRRSSPDVRDELIARAELDNANRNHILLALAWIGDVAVVELFKRWQAEPPSWRGTLYIPPQDYSLEAGWELTPDGRRRDLYFQHCTKLVLGYSTSPNKFKAITAREDDCPYCNKSLINLLDFVPSSFGILNGSKWNKHAQVPTCEVCVAFGTSILGFNDEWGNSHWAPSNTRPKYLPDKKETPTWGQLPQNSLSPECSRSPFHAADQFLPTTFSQLGGHPTWIQRAEYPKCSECAKTMMFLAQVDHADIEDHSEGVYYAFICPACGTTATSYQQT